MLNQIAAIHGTGAAPAAATSFESIATTTVGAGGAANVTFSSIASTWTHLQIRCFAETDRASGLSDMQVQLNSDTATNYSWHSLVGSGAAASASSGTSTAFMVLGSNSVPSSGAQPNIYNGLIIDILDYKDTNKNKTLRGLGGNDANGSGYISLNSGNWRSTSAITSIKLYPDTGNFKQYSSFALYGIKG